jgi:hypothetical protein
MPRTGLAVVRINSSAISLRRSSPISPIARIVAPSQDSCPFIRAPGSRRAPSATRSSQTMRPSTLRLSAMSASSRTPFRRAPSRNIPPFRRAPTRRIGPCDSNPRLPKNPPSTVRPPANRVQSPLLISVEPFSVSSPVTCVMTSRSRPFTIVLLRSSCPSIFALSALKPGK